jgi:hypothetical protein
MTSATTPRHPGIAAPPVGPPLDHVPIAPTTTAWLPDPFNWWPVVLGVVFILIVIFGGI